MKVKEIMNSPVLAVKPADTIAHAKNLMLRHKVKRLIVMDKGEPAGILTMHDMATRLKSDSLAWRMRTIDNISVSRVMSKGVISISLGTDVVKAAAMMLDRNISSLLVMNGKKVVGILTKTDIVRYFSESLKGSFKVKDLMSKDVVTVNRLHSIARVVELMEEYGVQRVMVKDGDRPIGLIAESDLVFAQLDHSSRGIKEREVRYTRKIERGGRPRARYIKYVALLTADDVMRRELITIGAEADVAQAASLMIKNGIGGVPVVEGEKLVGILTKTDITKGLRRLGV
ncbi:MAG: CBS domain-containing protein [Methanobacteriota archaeon]